MIEGVLRHCTDMTIEKNYTDSHGASEVAFAFSHLLGFELLPRLKPMSGQRLYPPRPVGCRARGIVPAGKPMGLGGLGDYGRSIDSPTRRSLASSARSWPS